MGKKKETKKKATIKKAEPNPTPYVMEGRVQIGDVGVDSGQILICDPCYIDSGWIREGYDDIRLHSVEYNGITTVIDMGMLLRKGIDYNTPLKWFDNKSMNQLVAEGNAKKIPNNETHVFSYNGCCRATQSEKRGGQLNFSLGHAGIGVALAAGYGDGMYPVFAHYTKDGRISKIEIIFI